MTKLSDNKKKIFQLILLLVSFFYAFGLNFNIVTEQTTLLHGAVLNLVFIIIACFFLAGNSYVLYKSVKSNDKKREFIVNHFFWAGWFFVLIMLFNFLKPSHNILSFYYLLLTVSFAFFNLWLAIFYFLAIVAVQYVLLYNAPWQGDLTVFLTFILLAVLFSVLGYMLKKERERKQLLKSRLKNIEEGTKSFFDDHADKSILALKEEKRVEKLYNTYNFFEEKVLKILQEIKDLMDPYTVAFLRLKEDGRYYRVFEAISEDDYIRHNEDISVDEGIIGWIYKHKKSINIGNLRSGSRALNYYDRDVSVKSFLGMPVFWKEKMVGILILDALQEENFSKESEKILKISCGEIEDALENAQLFRQIQQQMQEFGALYDASKKMLNFVSLEDNLKGFLELVSTFISFEVAFLCLFEDDRLTIKAE